MSYQVNLLIFVCLFFPKKVHLFHVNCEKSIWRTPYKDYVSSIPFHTTDGFVNVYVDGCCKSNGKENAIAGIGVWFNKHHPLNVFKPVTGRATNNNAEIQAAIWGINIAMKHGIRNLIINSDSGYVIKCMTEWIKHWKIRGWKTKSGNKIINEAMVRILDKCVHNMNKVKWVHVKGHSDSIGNREADKLARRGAELYKNTTQDKAANKANETKTTTNPPFKNSTDTFDSYPQLENITSISFSSLSSSSSFVSYSDSPLCPSSSSSLPSISTPSFSSSSSSTSATALSLASIPESETMSMEVSDFSEEEQDNIS